MRDYEEKIKKLLEVKVLSLGTDSVRAISDVMSWISCEFLLGNIESSDLYLSLQKLVRRLKHVYTDENGTLDICFMRSKFDSYFEAKLKDIQEEDCLTMLESLHNDVCAVLHFLFKYCRIIELESRKDYIIRLENAYNKQLEVITGEPVEPFDYDKEMAEWKEEYYDE